MGRQPLPLGSWGLISTQAVAHDHRGKPTRHRARAKFRDFDGVTRLVEASGRTATQASQNLRTKLQMRTSAGRDSELAAASRFSDAAALWMKRVEELVADGRRSPGTAETYAGQLRNHILPAMGELRLGEATTPVVDRVISSIKRGSGPASAKSCRSVISGVMGLAVRHGAVSANPVRDVDRIESRTRRPPRALSEEQRVNLLQQLEDDPHAVRHDLPDLVYFMLSTGVRIGEALAVTWVDVDLDVGVLAITSTLIRVKGEGLLRKTTKSRAGVRTLALPPSAVAMLRRRFMTGARLEQPVFPDVLGGFRDPANVRRALRGARGSGDLAWVTSHTFRKTAATILDEASLPARRVADQLGHARPSMTQDVYLGRQTVDPLAADALERALRRERSDGQKDGKRMGNDEGQDPGGP